MDLVHTVTTIETWISSCHRKDQLELLEDVVNSFITDERFPDERPLITLAAKGILFDKISEWKALLGIAKPKAFENETEGIKG
jgi:hypothetical protein